MCLRGGFRSRGMSWTLIREGKHMKRAILHGPRDLRLEEYTLPVEKLEPDQIWVKTQVTALSTGTDRGNYEGAEQVPGAPPYPRWVGYSNVGRVCGLGDAVKSFEIGDRVFSSKPHLSDYIAKEGELLVKVPGRVESEDAAFAYLYYLSLLSLRRGAFAPGAHVAVVGLGIIGLCTVELASALGGRVAALGNSALREEKARAIGAHMASSSGDEKLKEKVNEFAKGNGIDLVVLAANSWPAYRTAMEIAGNRGKIAILSLPGRGEPPPDFNPLAMEWFYKKELELIAVTLRAEDRKKLSRDLAYLLELMEQGTIQPKSLITHRLPSYQIKEAYDIADKRGKSMIGAVFTWC
jgi:threonine dehydrogenase-like Zn-dependent dehydrogenase